MSRLGSRTGSSRITLAPSIQPEKESNRDLLLRLWPSLPAQDKGTSPAQAVDLLLSLRYPDGSSILDADRPGGKSIIYTVFGIVVQFGLTLTVEYLQSVANDTELVWESPALQDARYKIVIDAEILRNKEKGIKGVGRCGRCGSTDLAFAEKQLRRADEPQTVFVRCIECGNGWTQ
jgi:DNA-directed RNA polymerase subunit M/transcription elongation factor TFIIS